MIVVAGADVAAAAAATAAVVARGGTRQDRGGGRGGTIGGGASAPSLLLLMMRFLPCRHGACIVCVGVWCHIIRGSRYLGTYQNSLLSTSIQVHWLPWWFSKTWLVSASRCWPILPIITAADLKKGNQSHVDSPDLRISVETLRQGQVTPASLRRPLARQRPEATITIGQDKAKNNLVTREHCTRVHIKINPRNNFTK
jgi:hypothetical protein